VIGEEFWWEAWKIQEHDHRGDGGDSVILSLYTYKAEVVRVIDGDTLVLNIDLGLNISITKHIRLLRVDTPELNSRVLEEREKAKLARDFVVERLPSGAEVIVKTYKSDSFGRYLGEIYYSENGVQVNLSDLLLEHDLARVYCDS